MERVQVKAEIPRELRRQFAVLLAAREQSFAGWLRDHMQATLSEAERRRKLSAGSGPAAPDAGPGGP